MAICLDLISPLFPRFFLLFICIASVMRAVVGVAGGATRAAITVHQARDNNMAGKVGVVLTRQKYKLKMGLKRYRYQFSS